MGRRPCCEKVGLNRGGWTAMEDEILKEYIKANGQGKWRDVPVRAGLKRCGKSCRLRWLNYLNPDIIRGNITPEEEHLIMTLHKHVGNRWSSIAGSLPGRTDNEIKNYWNTILYKKVQGHHQPPRKPRKQSNIDENKSIQVPMQHSLPSQENSRDFVEGETNPNMIDSQAPHLEYGDNCMADIEDNSLQFLFSEDINTVSWDEEIYAYQGISSKPALSSDDSMFDYWRENIFMEQNNTLEVTSLETLFESQRWP